jgi:outer membrane lipoprotein SlyB
MKTLALIATIGMTLPLTGCMSESRIITALSKDNAAVNVEIVTAYGTVKYQRAMPTTNMLTVGGQNGITTK